MFSRLGLRARMAISYVFVSAAAVLLVEVVLLAIAIPQIRAADADARQARARASAAEAAAIQGKAESMAATTASAVGDEVRQVAARHRGRSDESLLVQAAPAALGRDEPREDVGKDGPTLVRVVATTNRRVIVSSPAGVFAPGSVLPAHAADPVSRRGQTNLSGHPASWAAAAVELDEPAASGTPSRVVGIVYAVVRSPDGGGPDKAAGSATRKDSAVEPTADGIRSLVMPGLIALLLLLPVGGLFGMLSTGRLIRRIHRLADGTSAMAAGDLRTRIHVSGGDEVGRLERAFNSMAERLDTALREQRKAAESEAQRAERARIAGELHDSISQYLFSASVVAGGLRKALLPGSELSRQAESMELTLARTMREMRAMLLELRPIALEEAGLAEALEELCQAYRSRLDIPISALIDEPLNLRPPIEHAVFRVAQESLGNAARHGEPNAIDVRVTVAGGRVAVTISDDGQGFDPASMTGFHGMGLQLMRERIGELRGTVEVTSAPGRGTTVCVELPVD